MQTTQVLVRSQSGGPRLLNPALQRTFRTRCARFTRFSEFWPHYLRAHSDPTNVACHVAGLALSVIALIALLACGMVFFAALAAVPAQLGAWLGHYVSGEADAEPSGRPGWSTLAGMRTLWLALTGDLDGTVREVAR